MPSPPFVLALLCQHSTKTQLLAREGEYWFMHQFRKHVFTGDSLCLPALFFYRRASRVISHFGNTVKSDFCCVSCLVLRQSKQETSYGPDNLVIVQHS